MQDAIKALCGVSETLTERLGEDQLTAVESHINALVRPLTPDDIRALMQLLPRDGDTAFGLNWSLLHAIEAAPDWPMWDLLDDQTHEWVQTFRIRLANGGFYPPG